MIKHWILFFWDQKESKIPVPTTSFQHLPGSPSLYNRKEKDIKGIKMGKDEVKFYIHRQNDHLHKNPKVSMGKTTTRSSKYTWMIAGYEVNILKNPWYFNILAVNNEMGNGRF